MLISRRQIGLMFGLLLMLSGTGRGEDWIEIGTKIFVKSSSAPIQVENRIIGTGQDVMYPLTVRKVQGDWLWIWVDKKKTEGWIKRTNVCTARTAVDYFTHQIDVHSGDERDYQMRGMAWQELGRLDQALADITEAVRRGPSAALFNSRGSVWNAKQEYGIAISDYSEAIRLDPDFAVAYSNRGNAFSNKGEFDKALADFNEAIRLDPKDAWAYCNRGWAFSKKGEFEKALADYNEAIRLDPKDAWVYRSRGRLFSNKGEFDKALTDYNEAIRLDPKDANAYDRRGWVFSKKGEFDKALADFNEAIRLDPKDAWGGYNSVAWLRATCPDSSFRDGAKAIEMATKACELAGWKDTDLMDTLAAAYAESGQFEKAIEFQRKATEATSRQDKAEFQSRLDLYLAGQPYRETLKLPVVVSMP